MKTLWTPRLIETFDMPLPLLVQPDVHGDERGYFYESYRRDRYVAQGICDTFVQDNCSLSVTGTLRGLHLQPGQAKLVRCARGEIFDVVVDVRPQSKSFGRWWSCTLSSHPADSKQLYVPNGYAHGFYVTEGPALVEYKCSAVYDPKWERSLAWNDPEIGIEWPLEGKAPILSERDQHALTLAEGRLLHPNFTFSV